MEEKTVTGAPRQLVSFILDNSASCSKETLSALMGGFRRFAADPAAANVRLEWELISFDTFEPAVCKSFDAPDIAPVRAGRMPLLGRAIELAADRVEARDGFADCFGARLLRGERRDLPTMRLREAADAGQPPTPQ